MKARTRGCERGGRGALTRAEKVRGQGGRLIVERHFEQVGRRELSRRPREGAERSEGRRSFDLRRGAREGTRGDDEQGVLGGRQAGGVEVTPTQTDDPRVRVPIRGCRVHLCVASVLCSRRHVPQPV